MDADLIERSYMVSRRGLILGLAATAMASGVRQAAAQPEADWRRVSSGGGPAARWDHTLSAHAARKELLVAFGRDAAGTPLGDSWVTDRSSGEWAPLNVSGPSARFGHAVASDDASGLIYLFGGQQDDLFFNELWVLDLDAGRWELLAAGDAGPSPRYGTSLVHDGAGSLYVSHGFTFEGRFDDTWRFDLATATWDDASPPADTRPLKRCLHEAVWDDTAGAMWLYGGCSSGFGPCPQGDLWRFEPDAGSWKNVPLSGPAARSNPSLVLEPVDNRLVLFAGLAENGSANDLWIGSPTDDTMTWEAVSPGADGPSARSSHDAVISGGALYLFGGLGPDGPLGDLWRLKLGDPA